MRIPDIDIVTVTIADSEVGRLTISPEGLCIFEYSSNWLKNGFSISPFYLPLEAGVFTAKRDPFDGLFGVFNDSLPDGWGNLLIDRWLREQGIQPHRMSWLERLCIVGRSGMGALCYEPEVKREVTEEIRSLDFYAEEVQKILNEEPTDSLDELVDKAGSPGGARPKVLMNMEGKEWLVKFRSDSDPKEVGKLEYRYSKAAEKSGVKMPETPQNDSPLSR